MLSWLKQETRDTTRKTKHETNPTRNDQHDFLAGSCATRNDQHDPRHETTNTNRGAGGREGEGDETINTKRSTRNARHETRNTTRFNTTRIPTRNFEHETNVS